LAARNLRATRFELRETGNPHVEVVCITSGFRSPNRDQVVLDAVTGKYRPMCLKDLRDMVAPSRLKSFTMMLKDWNLNLPEGQPLEATLKVGDEPFEIGIAAWCGTRRRAGEGCGRYLQGESILNFVQCGQ
jgi:hypothetical protein